MPGHFHQANHLCFTAQYSQAEHPSIVVATWTVGHSLLMINSGNMEYSGGNNQRKFEVEETQLHAHPSMAAQCSVLMKCWFVATKVAIGTEVKCGMRVRNCHLYDEVCMLGCQPVSAGKPLERRCASRSLQIWASQEPDIKILLQT